MIKGIIKMERLDEAVAFAAQKHAGQVRKGSGTPYIVHPVEVLEIVCRITKDEDTRIAAVLHDTVEDTGTGADVIEEKFGRRVAELVTHESEDKRIGTPKSETWRTRKQETLDSLAACADADVKYIAFADKLSNLRSLQHDYDDIGDELWNRFNQKDPGENAWYYKSILALCPEVKEACPNLYNEYLSLLEAVFGPEP